MSDDILRYNNTYQDFKKALEKFLKSCGLKGNEQDNLISTFNNISHSYTFLMEEFTKLMDQKEFVSSINKLDEVRMNVKDGAKKLYSLQQTELKSQEDIEAAVKVMLTCQNEIFSGIRDIDQELQRIINVYKDKIQKDTKVSDMKDKFSSRCDVAISNFENLKKTIDKISDDTLELTNYASALQYLKEKTKEEVRYTNAGTQRIVVESFSYNQSDKYMISIGFTLITSMMLSVQRINDSVDYEIFRYLAVVIGALIIIGFFLVITGFYRMIKTDNDRRTLHENLFDIKDILKKKN